VQKKTLEPSALHVSSSPARRPLSAAKMASLAWIARIYCVLYAAFAAAVIGATIRMWFTQRIYGDASEGIKALVSTRTISLMEEYLSIEMYGWVVCGFSGFWIMGHMCLGSNWYLYEGMAVGTFPRTFISEVNLKRCTLLFHDFDD
jgi:hypothetical protein